MTRLAVIWAALSVLVIRLAHSEINSMLGRDVAVPAVALLPSPVAVKMVALGYDQVIADAYWLGFIQYIGDIVARRSDRLVSAPSYLKLVTELDPHFVQAYWFAAFVIGGDMNKPGDAAELLDAGIEANPDNWYLPYIAGMNQYLFSHNEVQAARYYRMAAKFPDAPDWLAGQARILDSHIPTYVKQINVWHSMWESAKDPLVKERARQTLIHLWRQVYALSPSRQIQKRALKSLTELDASISPSN